MIFQDAEGREFRTLTNRAGNFYVEGDESDLVLPYTAQIRAQSITPQMATSPMYGGCARCHGNPAEADGPFNLTPETTEYTNPTTDIFLPGLRESR